MAGFGQYIQNSHMGMTSNMEIPSMWQQQQQTFSNLNPAEYSYYYFPLEQQQLQFPAACDQYHNNFLSTTTSAHQGENLVAANDERRKSEVLLTEESVITTSNIIYKNNCSSASASTSSDFEGETNKQKKYRIGKGKKGRKVEKEEGKPGEVIHVRAKRGQATDSHSIAERVRREKINKKMRYLQDLVPGCHKTMGMAGMLEEIINYVHSLQNQVEFLSMELAAACSNKKSQGANNSQETTTEVEKWARAREQQYGGDYHTCFPSTWSL